MRDAREVSLWSFEPFGLSSRSYSLEAPVLRPSTALELNRNAVREVVGRYRAANPRIFGSALRGADRVDSDLDLLVDAMPGATLFDLGGLQEELEALLGVRVDVKTPEDLPAKFRSKVLAEAEPI